VNLLDAAERLAAIDRSEVVFDPQCCLHGQDRFSTCQACFDCCPVGAIQAGEPPQFNSEACVTCLACLPVCPVGAFAADDAVPALLNCLSRLGSASIELLCEVHPDIESGLPGVECGVQVRGCLAGLGAAAYLMALAVGVQRVYPRLEVCADCPVGALAGEVQEWVGRAHTLLEAWGWQERLAPVWSLADALADAEAVERPCWDADNPPLSRRDLFRLAGRQGSLAAARALMMESREHARVPGRERRRLLSVLPRLALEPVTSPPASGMDDTGIRATGFGWASLRAGCTACGVCARACPTGALSFEDEEQTFTLAFDPRLCIACETCVHVCAPDVLSIDPAPPLASVLEVQEAQVLLQGEFRRCTRCRARFAVEGDEKLCPVCEFRSKNPFGTALPPALVGKKMMPHKTGERSGT
jgi:ferredoxin